MAYQTINEIQSREYQKAWRSIVPKDATPLPAKYFKTNGRWLSGYEIDMEIQAQLDRNTAVERVVFSFVVQDDTVKIAMHGAGATTNEPLTPYYLLGTGIEKPLMVKAPAASVQPTDRATLANPSELAAKGSITQAWTASWQQNRQDTQLAASLFRVLDPRITDDARLISYPFNKSDIIAHTKVNLYFGAHKHPNPRDTSSPGRDLLSLIVEWIPDNPNSEHAYFDVSAPCPPCCPGCPD